MTTDTAAQRRSGTMKTHLTTLLAEQFKYSWLQVRLRESNYFTAESKLLPPPPLAPQRTPTDGLLRFSSSLRQHSGFLLKPYRLWLLTRGIESIISVLVFPPPSQSDHLFAVSSSVSLGHNSCY